MRFPEFPVQGVSRFSLLSFDELNHRLRTGRLLRGPLLGGLVVPLWKFKHVDKRLQVVYMQTSRSQRCLV